MRAYATNETGTAYGEAMIFTTLAPDTIPTDTIPTDTIPTDTVTTDTTGIMHHATANIHIYPNPTTGFVTIEMAPETCALNPEIQVFDVYGRKLSVVETFHETSLQTIQIDLSPYPAGIYLLKAADRGKTVAVGKVVKE